MNYLKLRLYSEQFLMNYFQIKNIYNSIYLEHFYELFKLRIYKFYIVRTILYEIFLIKNI